MRTNLFAAALAAFAIAALLAALLPSDNAVHAADPAFDSDTSARSVPENTPPGVNIGNPISATDADETGVEYGNTLTYSLGGTDAASFDIDPSTGQLITKAPLNFETKESYSVRVTVDDGETRGSAITQDVTISVTDVEEPPAAPVPPTVVSGAGNASTTSLKVVWHEPDNTGDTSISYTVGYKKTTELAFSTGDNPNTDATEAVNITGTTATITGLEADTSYHVRVQATSGEGPGPWSLVGTGSTNKAGNSPPAFTSPSDNREVAENTPAGQDVGPPVKASDADASALTYRLEGPDAALFDFVTSSGQIRTRSSLNHEDPDCGYVAPSDAGDTTSCTYKVTVMVADGAGGSDAASVSIAVDDRSEPVPAPSSPAVRPTENWSTRLDVSWSAPDNAGPPITGYNVRYRKGTSGVFSDDNCGSVVENNCNDIKATKITIVGLDAGASYQVQVLTLIADFDDQDVRRKSVPSATGTGSTNAANDEPIFDDRPSGRDRNTSLTITRNVDENTRSGQSVGGAVRAQDGDGHKRTYKLVDTTDGNNDGDAAKFDIDESTGQIKTKAALNHEDSGCGYVAPNNPGDTTTCTYTVRVEVRDGYNTHKIKEENETAADDSATVTITVRDRDEKPSVPTLTVTSPSVNTTLAVVWDAPANTGPAISGYDVQYRKGGGTFSDDNCRNTTANDNCTGIGADTTTTTITGLTADTSYSVQVRARNAEGVSAWSRLVTLKTNKGTNAPPVFSGTETTLTVAENTRSAQPVGDAVTATDSDSGTVSYSLEGADAASFTINAKTGEIKTKSSLDHEAPECGYDATDSTTSCSYSVRVRASDGSDGGSSSHDVTINVTDADEAPSKPAAPRVTATKDSGWSLDVTWNEPPQNAGKPPITDYDIQYRKFGGDDDDWQTWAHTGTDRNAKITTIPDAQNNQVHLEPRTQYEVEVRATNAEGTSDWSSIGRGTTGAGNSRPAFDRTEALVTLKVDENTRSGQNVGSAVSATDADGNRLRYSLEGPNKDSFTIVSSSGQIKTKAALDYETRSSYALTVKVDDGQRRANSVAAKSVRVQVEDVDEVPPPPSAPTVAGIPGSTDSVRVTWDASANTGPPVTDYEVQWGVAGSGGFRRLDGRTGPDRIQIITGLTAGTRYEVQVRARSAEGTSDWSSSGTGTPNPDAANRNPAFSGGARTLSVAENTAAGTDIGAPVAASDPDGDTLTYTLEGRDAASFSILSTGTGGQIQTSAALNHEKKSSHSVTVRVTDGRGGSNTATITITVTDVNGEAPDIPFAPTVTAVSSTSIQVTWDAPGNEGPPITDYDYRYKKASTWTEVTATTITATSVTIDGLTASTYYDVEVRATNAEGTSDWSNSGNGSTNAPGANSLPVFTEGTTAARSIHQTAAAGASIGDPVAATDADTNDKLTYTLEGTDAASFGITSTTGQLLTKSGVTLTEPGTTYAVTVVASDGKDRAEIAVTITIDAAPPNRPPAFAGASASRSVAETAGPGASVGGPVTATDPDEGDTLAYTLGGADAGLFAIGGGTGQITVGAGTTLDYETRTSYTVVVTATDPDNESAAITVTISVTDVGSGPYDTNDDGRIDRSEVIAAVVDYFGNRTDRATVIDLIRQYFSS